MSIGIKGRIVGFIRAPYCPWFILKRIELTRRELRSWFLTFVIAMPGEIGLRIRRAVNPFKAVGKEVRLLPGIWIEYPERLTIGDKTEINRNCFINAGGQIERGDRARAVPISRITVEDHA